MKEKNVQLFRKSLRKIERCSQIIDSDCCKTVTNAQCHVLLAIEESNDTTTKDLTDSLMLDKSTLSRTIELLVKKGLIKRAVDKKDRRFYRLNLTKTGKQTCDQINKTNNNNYFKILEKVTPVHQNKVINDFEIFANAMHDYIKEINYKCCDKC